MTNKYEQKKSSEIPEEEKRKLRKKTNSFISRYCGFAALVIILITFAAFILGEADGFYSQCGIMASIALLAISVINDPDRNDPDKNDPDKNDIAYLEQLNADKRDVKRSENKSQTNQVTDSEQDN